MTALKRFQRFFLLLFLGTVALGLFFNTWVNPWRVTPAPWSSQRLEPYRDITSEWNRTSKAGLVRSGKWDAALFGSSRVNLSLDPRHPALADYRCVNLGLNAALLAENHAMFRYYTARQEARLVVLAIDASDLTTPLPKNNFTDFALSPLAQESGSLERELRYHAGISTLAASFGTLGRALRREPASHTPEGFRKVTPFPEKQWQLISSLYLSTTVQLARGHMRYGKACGEKVDLVKDIIRRCRARDCRLVILFMPNHALFQLALREMGDPDWAFRHDRQLLAGLAAEANRANPSAPPVEVWDFLDGHPLNMQSLPPADDPARHLDHWIDLFHATPELGNHILDRLDGRGDYGVLLTPEMIDPHVERISAAMDRYAAENPDDIEFLRRSLRKLKALPEP